MFDEWYDDFSSNVSYYDFKAEDAEEIVLDNRMKAALDELTRLSPVSRDSLSELIKRRPELVHAVEVLLRDQSFSTGQWIYLLFDVDVLNKRPDDTVREYVKANLQNDWNLREIATNLTQDPHLRRLLIAGKFPDKEEHWTTLIAIFKASLVEFIEKPGAVTARISNASSEADRRRISDYLITRLRLPEFADAVNVEKYSGWKRRGKDTRGLHGRYGQERLRATLERSGFTEVGKGTRALQFKPQGELAQIHSRQGRAKKFDFLLLCQGQVKAAVETNFYESEGTKIGINQEEYLDIASQVEEKSSAEFYWVTDGSSWLTPSGKRRLAQLYDGFRGRIFNYNTFERDLPLLLESWKE